MTHPIRAFLIVRREIHDFGVHVCRDLDAVRAAWSGREDHAQSAVLHIGFDRPHSGEFEELLSANPGRMLLTASAIYALPSAFGASTRPIGVVGELPIHLGLTGWGYVCDDPADDDTTSAPIDARDWVAEYVRERPQDARHLIAANIVDERSYQANEARLPADVRHRSGLMRFNSVISGAEDDPCEIARAAPPWLQATPVENLNLTVRLENVFERAHIATIKDLADHSLADLLRLTNFGRKSAQDLRRILFQALDAGPSGYSPALASNEGEPTGDDQAERSTLIAQIHRTLSSCDQRSGDILSRRMGLSRPSETLQQIAETYGVTRERVRQIEAKTVQKIIRFERWDDLLTLKIRALLTDRTYPLPVLGLEVVDDWFVGLSDEVEALRYTLANFCEGRVSIVQIGAVEYIGFLAQGEWQSALAEAQQTLTYGSANGLAETELRRLLAPIIPEKAREFRALLWEEATRHCHFSVNEHGDRILVAHGRGVEHAVQAILFDAEHPLHYTEIAERVSKRLKRPVDVRRAHNAAAAVGILMGRGIFGAERHLGLTSAQIANVAEEASSIILNGPEGKQWHAAEVLAVLTERSLSLETLDKYAIDYCLRSGKGLQGLGRMAWRAAADAVRSSHRLEMRQAIEAVLMEAGKPLTTADLRQRLVALRGVNDIFQFSTADPLIRLGPGLWGLNDRDVSISRAEQRELFNDIVAILQARQTGIHVSEVSEMIGSRWGGVPAHIIVSLCNFDERLKVSLGQFVHLSEWEDARRQSILQTVQSLVGALPEKFSSEDVVRLVKDRTDLPFDPTQISACLRSTGAVYDSSDRVWSLGATTDDWDLDEAV
jgi:hypothetical protein